MAEKITLASITGPVPTQMIDAAVAGDAKKARELLRTLAARVAAGKLNAKERQILVFMLEQMAGGIPATRSMITNPNKRSKVGAPKKSDSERLRRGNLYLKRVEELMNPPGMKDGAIIAIVAKEFGVDRHSVRRDLEWLIGEGSWLERAKRALGKN